MKKPAFGKVMGDGLKPKGGTPKMAMTARKATKK